VRSDSAKFFGYFLPKKVTTRTNTALCLRHGVGRDAPAVMCCAGLLSGVFFSTKVHEGHEGGMSPHHYCRDMPPACPRCVCVELKLDLRLWGVVDHSTTPTRAASKPPAPAESAAVCAGKLQSKGLGFGASCKQTLGFTHSSRTETYATRGGD
jgi:hypothetical protein